MERAIYQVQAFRDGNAMVADHPPSGGFDPTVAAPWFLSPLMLIILLREGLITYWGRSSRGGLALSCTTR